MRQCMNALLARSIECGPVGAFRDPERVGGARVLATRRPQLCHTVVFYLNLAPETTVVPTSGECSGRESASHISGARCTPPHFSIMTDSESFRQGESHPGFRASSRCDAPPATHTMTLLCPDRILLGICSLAGHEGDAGRAGQGGAAQRGCVFQQYGGDRRTRPPPQAGGSCRRACQAPASTATAAT